MSEQAQNPSPSEEKSPEQLEEERKQQEEEERLREEERKKAEEEARIKAEEDMKKLEQALKGALSGLSKTASNRSLAYTKLTLAEKELQRLFPIFDKYLHVRHLDLNTNSIPDISSIVVFEHLQWLNASKNQLFSLDLFQKDGFEHLQMLNLSGNKIKTLTRLGLPCLRRLNLSENQISQVSWRGHDCIEILELRKNKLRNLKGLSNMKNLKELYVCENELTDIRGLESLPALWRISVRNNKLKNIYSPFPTLPALTYLNLRQNQIAKAEDLKKIDQHVTGINLLANPITDELGDTFRRDIVTGLPWVCKLNKQEVTVEERVAFEKEMIEKEKERLAAEEEARKAAEEKEAES